MITWRSFDLSRFLRFFTGETDLIFGDLLSPLWCDDSCGGEIILLNS